MVGIEKTPLNQLGLFLRIALPVALHISDFSAVNYFKKRGNFLDIQTDLSSILFSVLINIALGSRSYLLPRAYRPSNSSNILILNVSWPRLCVSKK